MKNTALLFAAMLALAAAARAQNTQTVPSGDAAPTVMFYQQFPAPPTGAAGVGVAGAQADVLFVAAGADKPVTGAPYTAEAVTESIQELPDGNRISNKSSVSLARDSQGRTRRQAPLGSLGPLPVKGPNLTFISDPVSQTDYVLDLDKQSARALQRKNVTFSAGVPGAKIQQLPFPPGAAQPDQAKTESLGTRTIEGVYVTGQRTTRTIAAGQIGNDRPIEITSEVWFSPELQVVVSSEHNDPRFGKTIYTLTHIDRAEPSLSLFEVPAGFTITETPAGEPGFGLRVGPPGTFELPVPPGPGISIERQVIGIGGGISTGEAGVAVGSAVGAP